MVHAFKKEFHLNEKIKAIMNVRMDFTLVTGRLVENVHQYLNVLRLRDERDIRVQRV